MIKINLATRKQAAGVQTSFSTAFKMPTTKLDLSGLNVAPMRKLIIALVVAYLAGWVVDSETEKELNIINEQIQKLEAEQAGFRAEIEKMAEYEKLKVSLDADKAVITTKLEVMTQLLENRHAPQKIIRLFSDLLPEDTWLSSVHMKTEDIAITGKAADFGSVSSFTKALSESAFFTDINPKTSERTTDELGNSIARFEIIGKRR